ncbi:hypothetical protein [Savagea faecisuis]|uniref:Homing endonuclease LAGLIDADG domain-containing protein n=1 Tax=Savagea faecisuis TaxID=1274803 RepID=A0ABW3GZN5_9BACL
MNTFYARMTGKLLGDGCITREPNRQPRFHYTHHVPDLAWTTQCYDELKSYIPIHEPIYRKVTDERLIKGYSENYFVRSRVHPIITKLYDIWYPNGTRIVPRTFVRRYFNAEALAWWYQDDGHLKIENGQVRKIILSTESFTKEENEWLIELLYDTFQLQFRRDKANRILLYDQFQCFVFLHIVEPYMNDCMERKKNPHLPAKPFAQKPAIRLPLTIQLTKPTAQLNAALERLDYFFDEEHVNMERIMQQFLPRSFTTEPKKHVQVRLTNDNRKCLLALRKATGLTLSELSTWCFRSVEHIQERQQLYKFSS